MRSGLLSLVFLVFTLSVQGRDYYITPNGETVYYHPFPRIFTYRPSPEETSDYTPFIPHGQGREGLKEPSGLFIDRTSRLYVSDAGQGEVRVYSIMGRFLFRIGKGPGTGVPGRPGPLALNPFGDLYIRDRENGVFHVFDFTGRPLATWEPRDGEGKRLESPSAFCISPGGDIFVVDGEKSKIHRYSHKRELLLTFGSFGTGPGELNHPLALASGREGEIYVADTRNHRIQVFRPDGCFLRLFGFPGRRAGELFFPHGLALDGEGRVAVTDLEGRRIQFFTRRGFFLGSLSLSEKEDSSGIRAGFPVFDAAGSLYIIDGMGREVLKIPPQKIVEHTRSDNKLSGGREGK